MATYSLDRCLYGTATASGYYGTHTPDLAFDDDFEATYWHILSHAGWIQYEFAGDEKWTIIKYTITISDGDYATRRSPRDWELQGSNDGSNWTTLDTQTGIEWSASLEQQTFTFVNTIAYHYYRLNITDNNDTGEHLEIEEIELMTESEPIVTYEDLLPDGDIEVPTGYLGYSFYPSDPGEGNRYTLINDPTTEEYDTSDTYIWRGYPLDDLEYCYFSFSDPVYRSKRIRSVTIIDAAADVGNRIVMMRYNGVDYELHGMGGSFENHEVEYTKNPITQEDWTLDDLDNLILGMGLRASYVYGAAKCGYLCARVNFYLKCVSGFIWCRTVEKEFAYTDEEGPKGIEGVLTGNTGAPGSIYICGTEFLYIDYEGNERAIEGDVDSETSANGDIWINDTEFFYLDEYGDVRYFEGEVIT